MLHLNSLHAMDDITYSCMFSVLGRNIQFCSDIYKCRVSDLTNLSFNVSIIDSACKGDIYPEFRSRSTMVWGLLMVRDNLIGLLDRHFYDSNVLDFVKWLCDY